MKLKPYFTILLAWAAFAAKAQKADSAQIIIHYKFTHVRDTNNRDKPLEENMVLLVGKDASLYKSYDRRLREEQMRKSLAEQINSGSTNIKVTNAGGPMSPNIDYYQYPNNNKFYTKERVAVNNYVIEEAMPAPAWKITADTSTIKGLQCQKATTHFKGRDYTAWFYADLPYRVGPWKLNGLPGLIVEAYDAKKEVVFKFDGLEKVDKAAKNEASAAQLSTPGRTIVFGGMDDGNQSPNLIALPANAIKTTPKELNELKEIMRKDPQAFMQSQMAQMNGQMSGTSRSFSMNSGGSPVAGVQSVSIQRAPNSASIVLNNPIELPEKGDKK